MNPQYRDMVLSGKITPVSKLSGAFLKPPTPMHLQLAYYESSMVVDYVVSHYGAEALKKILIDLGDDVPINQALAKYTEPIDKLDADFAKWLKTQAEQLAPKADLERPDLPLDADSAAMAAWNKDHPDNFWGLIGEGRALLAESKWEAAKTPLNKAIALYPNYAAPGGPYLLLASSFRQLGDTSTEKQMLQKHVSLNADAIEPRIRLMEIGVAETDWPAVRLYAQQILAINPLIPVPHRFLAQAAENLGDRALAIESQRILLLMDPLDRADHHYQLARLLVDDEKLGEARREVVMALEQAPRFLAAHRLLLQIVDKMGNSPTTLPTTQP
jgi:tetratricopeptide (TPR) repeat protein